LKNCAILFHCLASILDFASIPTAAVDLVDHIGNGVVEEDFPTGLAVLLLEVLGVGVAADEDGGFLVFGSR
jgi:hypothetical protein